jgi:hypothetical protein
MPPACLHTAETPLHEAPLVSTPYGAPLHVRRAYVSWHSLKLSPGYRPCCTFIAEAVHVATLTELGLRGVPRDTPPAFSSERIQHVAFLTHLHLRRRRSATFGAAASRICTAKQHSSRSSSVSVIIKSLLHAQRKPIISIARSWQPRLDVA